MPSKYLSNRKAKCLTPKNNVEEGGTVDTHQAEYFKTNGKLDVQGAGKKSLRKRSMKTLNGSSLNGPNVLGR